MIATSNNIDYSLSNLLDDPNCLLDASETLELINLEVVVEKSLRAFVQIGMALRSIRDKRLYRANYTNFHDYCINRWELGRRTSDQLIAAASLIENFERHGSQTVPNSERVCRPLTSLAPEEQLEIWHQAVETAPKKGKVTSNHVAKVVKDYKKQIKERLHGQSLPLRELREQGAEEQKPKNSSSIVKDCESVSDNLDKVNIKTCWDCMYSSSELIKEDPHSFYCDKLGLLDFIEKNGEERASECELWTERSGRKNILTPITVSLKKEEFTLTLQLPIEWQEKMENLANEQDLDVKDWVIQIIGKSLKR